MQYYQELSSLTVIHFFNDSLFQPERPLLIITKSVYKISSISHSGSHFHGDKLRWESRAIWDYCWSLPSESSGKNDMWIFEGM